MSNLYQHDFENVGEYLKFIQETPRNWGEFKYSTEEPSKSWHGGVSLDEAIKLAENGWPEGTKQLTKELDGMKGLTVTGAYKDVAHDVAGYLPDVPRAIIGMPDCMFNQGDEMQRVKPVIKMMYCMGGGSSINPKTFIYRGAAVLSYIDQLEQNCQRVELVLYRKNSSESQETTTSKISRYSLVIKRAGEPLDIDRVAYCIGHPSFVRRLGFRFTETNPFGDYFKYTYGTPLSLTKKELEQAGCSVHIPVAESNLSSSKEAVEYISGIITSQLTKTNEGE